ncbi:aldo/keto reductase [Pseudonocardia acaciae]|uniref:aldo/keto reductase n=1 Tax=Pseudonocardia acaciae TaxID=551276 RepID=UPI00048DA5E8|nr:aldo/keto reductase [Pseudonocardia acaciae]
MNASERLGLGLAALGRPAYINLGRTDALPPDRTVDELRAASWEVLDAGYAAGLRWVDVARSYGRAEEFLAGWLAARGHRDVTVSSKWGYAYVGGWRLDAPVHEQKEHSLARFRAQLDESRRLLGERLALYQVHSLTPDSPLLTDRELLAAMVDSGLPLGFSTSGPNQADTIARAMDLEVFTAVQSTWNPLEPSAAARLAEAHAAGLRVLVKEPLANGRLAVNAPEPVLKLAARYRTTPDAISLAAALSQPWADTVLLGPSSVDQLHANLTARSVTLTQSDLADLAKLAEPPPTYWTTRASLPWI